MFSENDYNENVYNILTRITKLNFKSQIKNSGIVFQRIYKIINLESNNEYYQLVLNDDTIVFTNQEEFCIKFIVFLEQNLDKLESQFDDFNKNNERLNKNEMFNYNDEVSSHINKQSKLLSKLKQYQKREM